jgi:hypothetical protein
MRIDARAHQLFDLDVLAADFADHVGDHADGAGDFDRIARGDGRALLCIRTGGASSEKRRGGGKDDKMEARRQRDHFERYPVLLLVMISIDQKHLFGH